MKSTPTLRFSLKRLFLLTLVSFVAVAAVLGIAASANKANRAAKARTEQAANAKSAINPAVQKDKPLAPLAAAITATLTDNLAPGTKVAPGGTINYTAVITNTNLVPVTDDAGSVVYNGNLDANTTISGLVQVSPVTINDTYPQTVIGNVSVNSANIPYSVVTNDYQGQNGGALTITAFDATTTAGGQIVMTTSGVDIGKFTYNPPPGFEGNDTFTYTFTNSVGSSVGTVTIPVSGMVWFINNNAGACTTLAGGCGRLSNPFSSLAAFQALNNGAGNNPAVNDNIFVFESATTYTGGVTLLGGQRFIGQDATDTLSTITGLTPPSGSAGFPAMNLGAPSTTITNGAGAGITLNAIGTSNLVRGMIVTNTSGAKILGNAFGTLTVGKSGSPDVAVNGTGQALNLTNGTFAATSGLGDVISTSSAGTGITLSQIAGTVVFGQTQTAASTTQGIFVNQSTLTMNFNNTTVGGGTDGISLQNNSAGTRTFGALTRTGGTGVGFLHSVGGGTTTVTGATSITGTGGRGIDIQDSTTAVTFANVTLSTTGGTGVFLDDNSGAVTFADLDITPINGQRGFQATEPHSGTITTTSGTIATVNATAVEITGTSSASRTPLNMTLTSVSAVASGGNPPNGIVLSNVNGPAASVGFSIIGDNTNVARGGNATGGTIANTTGATGASTGIGVRLENADEVALRRLQINDHPNFAVYANNTSNVTLAFTTISGTNGTADGIAGTFFTDEAAVLFANMTGADLVDRCKISGGIENNMTVVNDTGTLNRLVIDDTEFGLNGTALGADSLLIVASGLAANPASTVNVTIEDSDFLGARGDVIQSDFRENGKLDLIMERNDISNSHTNKVSAGGGCTFAGNGNALAGGVDNFTYNIGGATAGNGNTFRDALGTAVALDMGTGKTNGRFRNNSIGVAAVANSASTQAGAFAYIVDPGGNNTVAITNNTIRQYNNHGILLQVGDIMGLATTVNMTVTGNSVNTPGNLLNDFNAIHLNHGTVGTDNMTSCVDIGGAGALANSVANGGDGVIVPNSNDIRLRQRQATTVRLPGYGGANNDNTAVQNYLLARNTTQAQPLGTAASNTVPTGGGFIGGAACTQPSNPAMPESVGDLRFNQPAIEPAEPAIATAAPPTQLLSMAATIAPAAAIQPRAATFARVAVNNDQATASNGVRRSHHAQFKRTQAVKVSASDQPLAPLSGEAVGPINIGTLPAGKSVTIKYAATVNGPPLVRQVEHQGTVTFTGGPGSPLLTDDPDLPGLPADKTITLIDTTETWVGAVGAGGTDWNLNTNWNPAFVPNSVSDVVIPSAGVLNEPSIISPDVNVFSLNLQSGRTLTINPGRVLTVNTGLTTLAGALAGGPYTLNFVALTINRAAGITVSGPTSVSGVLTLTNGNVTTGANVLTVGNAGSIVRTSGHIIGSLKKTNVAAAFIFTVGTANGYTPLDLSSPSGGGDLTVTTVAAPQPTLQANNPGKQLNEYWTLNTAGTLTASLVFHYLQTDVPGTSNENSYRIVRVSGATPESFFQTCPTTSCVDPAGNTATKSATILNNPGNNGADWTVGEVLVPTAADGVVSGRIVDANGRPVEGAVVRLNGTQNRKFITDANGFYRFDNVETSGFYTVTPSRANYQFSPTIRSFSLLAQTTEAIFTANATGQTANPLDTPEYFVRQHYLDFLGREPDEAGFNFWSDQIIECGGDADCTERRRENVSAAYFLSIEFQKTGGLVDGLYRASYGTRPQFGEFMPDTRAVGLGVRVGEDGWEMKLQANKEAFATAFVNRAAFHARYDGMDASTFVETLINNTGVNFTSAERAELIGGLTVGNLTRADVVRSIAENQRYIDAKFNDSFVMMQYFGYLRRDADPSGFAFWLNKLNEFNGNFEQAEMVKAFIVSGEFRDRFPR